MRTHNELLEELKQAPDVLLLLEEVKKSLERETQKRQEFYDLIHEEVKAEFINGKTIFHSPVKYRHLKVSARLSSQLISYVDEAKLGVIGVEKMMIRLSRNDYEPDICFFTQEKAEAFTDEQMIFPAPDFVVEIISNSTKDLDYGIKYRDYAAHGITEYWIIDPDKQTVEQYHLQDQSYELMQKVSEGEITSIAVRGFILKVADLFS